MIYIILHTLLFLLSTVSAITSGYHMDETVVNIFTFTFIVALGTSAISLAVLIEISIQHYYDTLRRERTEMSEDMSNNMQYPPPLQPTAYDRMVTNMQQRRVQGYSNNGYYHIDDNPWTSSSASNDLLGYTPKYHTRKHSKITKTIKLKGL